ncbi:hypothetical protein A3Q56_07130, partial [Intoshia linei]
SISSEENDVTKNINDGKKHWWEKDDVDLDESYEKPKTPSRFIKDKSKLITNSHLKDNKNQSFVKLSLSDNENDKPSEILSIHADSESDDENVVKWKYADEINYTGRFIQSKSWGIHITKFFYRKTYKNEFFDDSNVKSELEDTLKTSCSHMETITERSESDDGNLNPPIADSNIFSSIHSKLNNIAKPKTLPYKLQTDTKHDEITSKNILHTSDVSEIDVINNIYNNSMKKEKYAKLKRESSRKIKSNSLEKLNEIQNKTHLRSDIITDENLEFTNFNKFDLSSDEKDLILIKDEQIISLEAQLCHQENVILQCNESNKSLYTVGFKEIKSLKSKMSILTRQKNTSNAQKIILLQEEVEKYKHALKTKNSNQNKCDKVSSQSNIPININRINMLSNDVCKLQESKKQLEMVNLMLQEKIKDFERKNDDLNNENYEIASNVAEIQKNANFQMEKLSDKYSDELKEYKRKIQWFIDNQKLLDSTNMRHQQNEKLVLELEKQNEALKNNIMLKDDELCEYKHKPENDSMYIRDLERQIKEMEQILKRRDPNSIPVLMWAEKYKPSGFTNKESNDQYPTIQCLENTIKTLEKSLKQKDDENRNNVKVIEQKYVILKCQYDEQLKNLSKIGKKIEKVVITSCENCTETVDKYNLLQAHFDNFKSDQELLINTMNKKSVETKCSIDKPCARSRILSKQIKYYQDQVNHLKDKRKCLIKKKKISSQIKKSINCNTAMIDHYVQTEFDEEKNSPDVNFDRLLDENIRMKKEMELLLESNTEMKIIKKSESDIFLPSQSIEGLQYSDQLHEIEFLREELQKKENFHHDEMKKRQMCLYQYQSQMTDIISMVKSYINF